MVVAPQGRHEGSWRRWDPLRDRWVGGAGVPVNVEEVNEKRSKTTQGPRALEPQNLVVTNLDSIELPLGSGHLDA